MKTSIIFVAILAITALLFFVAPHHRRQSNPFKAYTMAGIFLDFFQSMPEVLNREKQVMFLMGLAGLFASFYPAILVLMIRWARSDRRRLVCSARIDRAGRRAREFHRDDPLTHDPGIQRAAHRNGLLLDYPDVRGGLFAADEHRDRVLDVLFRDCRKTGREAAQRASPSRRVLPHNLPMEIPMKTATKLGGAANQFLASMQLDVEKWKEGISYDLDALDEIRSEELKKVAAILIANRPRDWRDIEALAQIDFPEAQQEVEAALKSTDPKVRQEAMEYAGHKLDPKSASGCCCEPSKATTSSAV